MNLFKYHAHPDTLIGWGQQTRALKKEWSSRRGNVVFEERWTVNGVLHRDNDLPAGIVYTASGAVRSRAWYQRGELHRDNGPAVITGSSMYWWKRGKMIKGYGDFKSIRNAGMEHWLKAKNLGKADLAQLTRMSTRIEGLSDK
jgi:hypothetical protein